MNHIFLSFHRASAVNQADLFEKAANVCLGLLRLACSKTIEVEILNDNLNFKEKTYSPYVRITAIVAAIFTSPILIRLSLIGYGFLWLSKSHNDLYLQFQKRLDENTEHNLLHYFPLEITSLQFTGSYLKDFEIIKNLSSTCKILNTKMIPKLLTEKNSRELLAQSEYAILNSTMMGTLEEIKESITNEDYFLTAAPESDSDSSKIGRGLNLVSECEDPN